MTLQRSDRARPATRPRTPLAGRARPAVLVGAARTTPPTPVNAPASEPLDRLRRPRQTQLRSERRRPRRAATQHASSPPPSSSPAVAYPAAAQHIPQMNRGAALPMTFAAYCHTERRAQLRLITRRRSTALGCSPSSVNARRSRAAGRKRAAALANRAPTWSSDLAITGKPGGKGTLEEALAQSATKQNYANGRSASTRSLTSFTRRTSVVLRAPSALPMRLADMSCGASWDRRLIAASAALEYLLSDSERRDFESQAMSVWSAYDLLSVYM